MQFYNLLWCFILAKLTKCDDLYVLPTTEKLFNKVMVSDGIYRMEFDILLSALHDIMHYWDCKRTAFIIEANTGIHEKNVLKFFQLKKSRNVPDEIITLMDGQSDQNYCKLADFRFVVYIGFQNMLHFFSKIGLCYGLFDSMHTWIIAFPYWEMKDFESKDFLPFMITSMSQITVVAPQPSQQRQQRSYTYKSVNRLDIYDIFYSELNSKIEAVQFAYWSRSEKLHYFQTLLDKQQLRGRKVRLVTTTSSCPILCADDITNSSWRPGFMVDLFSGLESSLNAKHEYSLAADNSYGAMVYSNGTFNGFLGNLQRGEHDIGMMLTGVTKERMQYAVHFGGILTESNMRMAIKKPSSLVPPIIYVLPFQLSVWLTVLGFIIIIYMILAIIRKLINNPQNSEEDAAKIIIKIRRKVTFDVFDQTYLNGVAARVVVFTQITTAFMIFTYYTSILTSVLTYREAKLPFETLEEMTASDDYKVIVVKNTIYQSIFKQAEDEMYKRIWRNIISKGGRSGLLDTFGEGFVMLERKENYVYVTNGYVFQQPVKRNCHLIFTPAKYIKEYVELPVRKDFPYLRIYANSILRLHESGVMKRLDVKYVSADYSKCDDTGVSETLEITQVYGLFVFQVLGMILAIFVMIVEILFDKYSMRNL